MNGIVEVVEHESPGMIRHDDAQIDLFFKMHQKINAKNEEVSKSYKNNILVKFSDIKELHFKTVQSVNSLKPIKSNINVRIAVSHNEGESEKFNSFEEFESRNLTNPNPTSDILLIYSFSVYDKEENDFENYKIMAHVRSRVAELHQIEKEAPPFISSALISNIVTTTAKITVHYSDYVKARHFTAMFDEWIRGCDESKNIDIINKLKKVSHLISKFGKLSIYAVLGFFTVTAIDISVLNYNEVLKFLVAYASIFVIVGGVSEVILRKLELSIDSYLALSYLNINKGDAKLISDFSERNRSSIIWSLFGVIGTIGLGIATSASYDFIKWLIA
ncbi:hypothetical protein OQJ62_15880 [Microbulbifer thermotolerans]|uniref:hypothetical protein n=1 Tax=Microbulbifer thermotolerans TaxID=252514 RepID=UPI0022499E45|nr:hypothetical protein [Microbulbifer thermotolerans]MCX2796404.1 hypothetical protein [Microbulbifer thermotolerans]